MDEERRTSKMFRIGMLLQKIAMLVDDDTLKKIKPTMESLENELIEVFEQTKEVQ